ncbi:hypothetical protein [uncultured Alcanivorax sp.]|jgi:hypothetical protein|uniref:hypothetical protein n=1 Tax=uncultured Alcanivorax sp. TaxID=191215 RepID=UPI0032B184FF
MASKSITCMSKLGEPLTEYEYEVQAESAANYINTIYGNDLIPYDCTKCSYWHLTPKSRHTPSRTCDYCTSSSGEPKSLYETREGAEKRAEILAKQGTPNLRVYECPYENGWHLTSSSW